MLLPRVAALLLAVSTAKAFKDASPFFLLSSEPLKSDAPLRSTQIALTKDVEDRLIETLQDCEQKWYYIFSQDSVRADDFKASSLPKLQKRIAGADAKAVIQIPEVALMGELNAESIQKRLEAACSLKGKKSVESWPEQEDEYRIVTMQLPELASESQARAKGMADTDDAIDDTVASVLGKDGSAVLIYITTSPPQDTLQDGRIYEMDEPYPSSFHTDLKRDVEMHARRSNSDNMQDGLPLFEKYQFLSPAIFMSLAVSLMLVLILYVGLSAISGLEVSYMAFSKEMGPQASKNKQQ